MRVPVPSTPIPAPSPAVAPWGFSNGQLETLKWLAMGFMFLDHIGRLLLGYGVESWVFAASRITYPLFALVLALNLARTGDRARRCARTTLRLGLWCLIAVGPSILARGEPWLVNVLGTLGLGAALCWALAAQDAPDWLRIVVAVAGATAAQFVEFGVPGVLMIPAIFLWAAQGRTGMGMAAGIAAAALLGMTAWQNGQFGGMPAVFGTLAMVPLAAVVRALPVSMPRWQTLFYLVYPLHLAIIGALRMSDWP